MWRSVELPYIYILFISLLGMWKGSWAGGDGCLLAPMAVFGICLWRRLSIVRFGSVFCVLRKCSPTRASDIISSRMKLLCCM